MFTLPSLSIELLSTKAPKNGARFKKVYPKTAHLTPTPAKLNPRLDMLWWRKKYLGIIFEAFFENALGFNWCWQQHLHSDYGVSGGRKHKGGCH